MTETVTEALNEARLFIEAEYADPAAAVDGEWLAKEARAVHAKLCDAIVSRASQPVDTGVISRKALVAVLNVAKTGDPLPAGLEETLLAIPCITPPLDSEAVERVRALEDRLEICAGIFENYGRMHREKGTEEGDLKAERNEHYARQCRALLSLANPVGNGDA